MKPLIYPYNKFSKSAKLLAKEMGTKLIKLKNSKFKWDKPVVNWGNPNPPGNCLNKNVKFASNKLDAFNKLKENPKINIPPFTTEKITVMKWLKDGHTVLARTKLNGKDGEGIVILTGDTFTLAPLYTKYIKKQREFRVHVLKDNILMVFEKKKKKGAEHNLIRNTVNNYAFCFVKKYPDQLKDQALMAVKQLELDFGGVDIIWNNKQQKAYVLEVNTAPGLGKISGKLYAEAFKQIY